VKWKIENGKLKVKKNRSVKIITTIIITAILITLTMPLSAMADDGTRATPRFTDTIGLLTSSEATELTNLLDEISIRQNFDVVVAVTNSMSTVNPERYAADFFEAHGFGFGENLDGIILMVALEPESLIAVSAFGYGEYAFTNAGREHLIDLFFPYLRSDRFFEAFSTYANSADDFVTSARAGERVDTRNIRLTPHEQVNARIWAAVISVVIAAIIAGSVVMSWTRQLKSVKQKDFACDYIRGGSFALTQQRDIFLYRNIRRIPRQQQNSGGGRGGGSFRSSSGRSFSGSSRRF